MAISKINLWNHSKLFGSIQGYLIMWILFFFYSSWMISKFGKYSDDVLLIMAKLRHKLFSLFLFGYLTHRLVTPDNYQEHGRGGNWHLRGVWSSQGIGLMVTFMITFNIMPFWIREAFKKKKTAYFRNCSKFPQTPPPPRLIRNSKVWTLQIFPDPSPPA